MGLLTLGQPLSWNETKSHAEHVRSHGIRQFVNIYQLRASRTDEELRWGDEIEYMVVKFDHQAKKVRVSCRAEPLLKKLQEREEKGECSPCLWRPEYGAYMVEGTPGAPYGMKLCSDQDQDDHSSNNMFSFLKKVEENMRLRRTEVRQLLEPDESLLTISSFPRLGTLDFCTPPAFVHPTHGFAQSIFFPDEVIYQGHPRFSNLSNNIRERRGRPVAIYQPIFYDKNTPNPFVENFVEAMNLDQTKVKPEEAEAYTKVAQQRQQEVSRPGQVYMDAMGFGMGCCCLQVTFQASTINEACCLYDQLTPLTPILMALSAASPIFRGYLTDADCRWSVIAASVDDRTQAEQTGIGPDGKPCQRIPKSRYDSIDLYISEDNVSYNDIDVVYDEKYYKELLDEKIPEALAKHIAHLFIRDPLVLFKEKLNMDDTKESDHFENIQSTNWQTMRFKPPPLNSPEIGWRVEFRPMEVQLTDTENAAFVIFIVLLTRLILSFNLNLLIPMSKVEENMEIAKKRDAVRQSRFWFRRDMCLAGPKDRPAKRQKTDCDPKKCYIQLSIDQIINGTRSDEEASFPGLIPLLNSYLDNMEIDAQTRCTISQYLQLLSKRARGDTPTAAYLIRQLVTTHPEYKHDSVVSDRITYDLLSQLNELQTDQITLEDLIKKIPK